MAAASLSSAAFPAAMGGVGAANQERDEYEAKVRKFSDFIHSQREEWEKALDNVLANNRSRVRLDLKDLKKLEDGLDRRIMREPVKYLPAWEEALLSFLRETNEKAAKALHQALKIDIHGSFGRNHLTPRGMNHLMLSQLVKVEGIVTKAGLTAPKILQSMHVHKNLEDGHIEQRDHRDQTAFVNSSAAGAMPTADSEGNELSLEIGLSVYKDYQKFLIQEAPEAAPAGQIPRSIEVICEDDLADKAKPGDRVQVTGVYKSFPRTGQEFTDGVWPARLIATNITLIKEMTEAPFVSDDIKNIKAIAGRKDAFALLARSFAPSICGHEKVKAGLLLQMVGGTEKNLPNGTHLRGDINVLLVGDPSCGKSQMLRFVMNTAPLAISTTGRGSSGVGLTAAMIRDPATKEFALEAGAMVLADRGCICIDEFDKMGLNDRVAIHEAMEQQCVTIAKAGMHVTLNARCSVTAAANPRYGNFDPTMSLTENIGLPDSLLSRFDLIYIVRDLTTEEIDRKIATQVLRQAQQRFGGDSRRRGVEHIHSSILERRQEVDMARSHEATEVFEKHVARGEGEEAPEVLTVDFLRKYLRYCRRLTPVLSEAASVEVANKYSEMRTRFMGAHFEDPSGSSGVTKSKLAVTTRSLEALIRLATAHAKLKLRKDEVLPEDVDEAYRLMLTAREEEVRASSAGAVEGADDDGDEDDDGDYIPPGEGGPERKRRRTEDGSSGGRTGEMSEGRFATLRTLVARAFARSGEQQIARDSLLESVNAGLAEGEVPFGMDEFAEGLTQLELQNKIMNVTDTGDVIFVG